MGSTPASTAELSTASGSNSESSIQSKRFMRIWIADSKFEPTVGNSSVTSHFVYRLDPEKWTVCFR